MSTRSTFLAASTASALALGVARTAVTAAATPGNVILDEATFRAHVASSAKQRQAIGSSRVNDASIFQYAVNTLNGFTSGWNEPPANVQIALVLYGSGSILGLDDDAWKAHGLADIVRKIPSEWITVDGSQGNPWSHASPSAKPNTDKSVPALLSRGVKIFVCNTALGDMANRIVAAGMTAGAGNDAFAIQAHLREHVLPGCEIVPAGISSMSVLQSTGYTYFSAAA